MHPFLPTKGAGTKRSCCCSLSTDATKKILMFTVPRESTINPNDLMITMMITDPSFGLLLLVGSGGGSVADDAVGRCEKDVFCADPEMVYI